MNRIHGTSAYGQNKMFLKSVLSNDQYFYKNLDLKSETLIN